MVDHDRSRRILVAVSAAVASRLGAANWVTTSQVMAHLVPDESPWNRKTALDRYRRYVRGMSEDNIAAIAASVEPETYRDTLEHILQHGRAPEEAPPVVPGVNAEEAKEKEFVPPPHRSAVPEERVSAKVAKILQDHDRKVAAKLVDQAALNELLVQAVTDGVKLAPPVIWRPAPEIMLKEPVVEEVPVALLSDIHGGTLVDAEEMGGLGEFNMEVFRRRLDTYQSRIAHAIDLHRRDAKIRKMVVYMLGDMMEGEVIFDGQAFRIELIVTDQLFEVASYIAGWLQGLLATGLVEEVHCVCLWGNHGRTTHKKGASKGHSNWDYVLYKHLEAVLANENRIKWFIPKAWFAIVDVLGWRIYGTHGDVVKSWMGIPFYGIQRHDMRTTKLLQSVGMDYNYMVYGDKHITATIPMVSGAQIMNGSIVGGSDFSMHILGTASEPMQTMFGINERHGRTWQYDFVLERRDPAEIRKHLAFTRV